MTDELRMIGRSVVRGGRRAVHTVAGFSLVLIGLAGLVLPVVPGWVLIIAGFAVLGREYAWARRALESARSQAARSRSALRAVLRRPRRPVAAADLWPAQPELFTGAERDDHSYLLQGSAPRR